MFSFLLGLIAGLASPTQASVNSRIREDLKSPYITSIYNFICAVVIMAAAMLVIEKSMYIPVGKIAEQPFWIWLGGTCGTFIVFLNIICLPKLGSARNVMILCFGQTMTGLLIDNFGLFGSSQIPMDMKRTAGAVLVLVGIALVNIPAGRDREENSGGAKGGELIVYMLLSALCGFACAAQVALNGTLREYAGSAVRATFISMAVGLISILILTLIVMILKGKYGIYDGGADHGPLTLRAWMPIGGALAIVIVGCNAIAAPVLGTGIVTILNLVGMMAAGLAIDATGFLGIEKKPVTAVKVAGMLLMTGGSALISLL